MLLNSWISKLYATYPNHIQDIQAISNISKLYPTYSNYIQDTTVHTSIHMLLDPTTELQYITQDDQSSKNTKCGIIHVCHTIELTRCSTVQLCRSTFMILHQTLSSTLLWHIWHMSSQIILLSSPLCTYDKMWHESYRNSYMPAPKTSNSFPFLFLWSLVFLLRSISSLMEYDLSGLEKLLETVAWDSSLLALFLLAVICPPFCAKCANADCYRA